MEESCWRPSSPAKSAGTSTSRLAKAKRHIGATCSLELAFGHNSHSYCLGEARPDWYEDFLDACEEISSVLPIDDDDSDGGDGIGGGGFYSNN